MEFWNPDGMHALAFHQHGPAEQVLQWMERPSSPLGPGQVRVRMIAAPINPSDRLYIEGRYGRSPESFPAVPGFEGVGVVVEARGLLGKLWMGRRVCVLARESGTWATEVVTDAKRVIPLPSWMSDEQGATFFINPATALILTRKLLSLGRGDRLIQTGASSQVGRMVIRLGRHFGFNTINIVRHERHVPVLEALGAEACVVHDSREEGDDELLKKIREAIDDVYVDAAIDCVGGGVGSTVLAALSGGGRMVVYGTLDERPLTIPSRILMSDDRSVEGFWLGPWMERVSLVSKIRLMGELRALHRKGIFDTPIAARHPLPEFGPALAETASGKVLFRCDSASSIL